MNGKKMDVKCIGSNNQIEIVKCEDNIENVVSYCGCKHCFLGEGAYGAVYKGKLENDEKVAVKRVAIGNGRNEKLEEVNKEAQVMRARVHENILKFHFYIHKGNMA